MISSDIIAAVCAWWRKRRFYRSCPEYRDLCRKEAAARAKHKPVKVYQQQKKELVTGLLRGRHG